MIKPLSRTLSAVRTSSSNTATSSEPTKALPGDGFDPTRSPVLKLGVTNRYDAKVDETIGHRVGNLALLTRSLQVPDARLELSALAATAKSGSAAAAGDKEKPADLDHAGGATVDVGNTEGKERIDKFHLLTEKNPLADVIGSYLDTVKDNHFAVDGVKDQAQFSLNLPGIDRFLSPSGSIDFRNVNQGQVADCFLASAFAAVMAHDEGRLTDLIHPTADGKGYEVSLYRPSALAIVDDKGNEIATADGRNASGVASYNGSRTTVFVSKEDVDKWHSVYHPGDTDKTLSLTEVAALRVTKDEHFLDTGSGQSALYLLTGNNSISFGNMTKGTNITLGSDPVIGKMTNEQLYKAAETALASGTPITLSMIGQNLNGLGVDSQFKLQNHDFTVVDATPDGVIVRNPWGGVETGSVKDKPSTYGDGIMVLSWSQFKETFNSVTVGNAAPASTMLPQSMTHEQLVSNVRTHVSNAYAVALQRDFPGASLDVHKRDQFVQNTINTLGNPTKLAEAYVHMTADPNWAASVIKFK